MEERPFTGREKRHKEKGALAPEELRERSFMICLIRVHQW